jgi:hypothetical protein
MTKQEAVIKYITENYLEYNRLRHDVISDKLQLRMEKRSDRPNGLLEVRLSEGLLDRSCGAVRPSNLTGEADPTASNAGSPTNIASLWGANASGLTVQRSHSEQRELSVWCEMTKQDINSIVCHCAQEYNANITTREVITALQSDLIPNVHPLREYILSLRPYTPDQPDWIDFVAQQVRVKAYDSEIMVYKNDNLDNLRPNQYPLGALGEDKNQQLKQLDPTTYSARNNTASGEGNNTTPDRPKGLSERTSCCQTTTLLDRPYRAERPKNLTGEADLTVSEANGLASNSSQRERSEADRLWRVCFKKWFVAMVASWMRDEVVNHQVLVLIGRQGIYKTTWLEHLIPPHLRAYTCKLANSNDLNKDERLRIAEFGLISLDEIDSMNNRELNQLKSVITATDVNERAAYAYTKERRVRLASFCASGNRRDFLTDITGNRRWLPFEVESIQNPFYTTLPYELMYAQAWALAQDPMFSYWFELDEIAVLEQHNQHFRDESNEEQLLDVYFAVPPTDATTAKFLTTAEISERLIYYGNIKKPMTLSRLGVLLSQKGFLSVRRGNPSRRGWIIYERESQEVNAERSILSK